MKNVTEKKCSKYLKGTSCGDGRDHCFNCARHLTDEKCPAGCGEGNAKRDEAANDY